MWSFKHTIVSFGFAHNRSFVCLAVRFHLALLQSAARAQVTQKNWHISKTKTMFSTLILYSRLGHRQFFAYSRVRCTSQKHTRSTQQFLWSPLKLFFFQSVQSVQRAVLMFSHLPKWPISDKTAAAVEHVYCCPAAFAASDQDHSCNFTLLSRFSLTQ